MPGIMDMLKQQLAGAAMQQMGAKLGLPQQATQSAVGAALPVILGALARNSQSNSGAESLNRAVEKDHDGGILDNLGAMFGSQSQETTSIGGNILKHVLGSRQSNAERAVAQSAGMSSNQSADLLKMLAPVVMGALGKKKRDEGLGANDLARMLGQERETIEQAQPKSKSMLGGLLDADGDGDVDLSDLASGFGKFFG